MIWREEYLNQLISFKDKQLIKVVTGIRRCGKSTIFELYQEYLMTQGVTGEQIIAVNLEDVEYFDVKDYRDLYERMKGRLLPKQKNYIFFDEIQLVKDFQKLVDGLFIKKNCDVYITGSNAYLLSGELATLLSGRYVEIKMLPLSFQEYVSAFPKDSNIDRLYSRYITQSSFPYTLQMDNGKEVKQYLDGIMDSIILKDVLSRKKLQDLFMLQSVIRFMADNIGNLNSTKKIADTMTSDGRKISVHTVESYLEALTDSFILYRVGRYDVKGKQYLKTGEKYYLADVALRNVLLGSKRGDDGHILENVVYLELLRRGYDVYVGKVDNAEVDFIAIGSEGEEYYQVAYTVNDADGRTLDRELAPLNAVKNHNPKFLLTMDYTPFVSHNGIKQLHVLDWLLKK